jgi:iron complex transport system substrate-binding protein
VRLLSFLLLLLLVGCEPPKPPAAAFQALTVEDDLGRRVSFPTLPKRIVSLAPAHTETLYAIGAGELVVGADTYSEYPPEAKPKAKLNCWPRPPLEQIVALKPDLVVVLTQDLELVKQLDAVQIPMLKLFPKTVEKSLEEMVLLGKVAGRQAEAEKLVLDIRTRLEAVQASLKGVKPVTFMYELDALEPSKPFVAGPEGFYGDMMKLAGGKNVFSDLKGPSAQVSAEHVVARSPEVILLGDTRSPLQPQSPELVSKRPGWGTVAAVKTGRIYPVDSDFVTRPGPRLIEGLERVSRLFHPERFK